MYKEKYTIQEVYEKTRQEAQHYFDKSKQTKKYNGKQIELYVNLEGAFNLVSMWLEKTEEINPSK